MDKTKVVHCEKEPYDVYIGRPSKWGNPFSHKFGDRCEMGPKGIETTINFMTKSVLVTPSVDDGSTVQALLLA